MIRRKTAHPSTNGAAPGSGSAYGQAGYGTPAAGLGYGSHVGYGAAAPQVGGYGYGNASTSANGAGAAAAAAAVPRYSGYGTSSTGGNSGAGAGAGFGVGMGEASFGESPYGSDDRTSLKGKKRKSSLSSPISLKALMDKAVMASFVAFLMLGMAMYYRSQYKTILKKLHVQTIVEAVKSYEKLELDKKRFQKEALSGKESDRSLKNSIRELEKTNRELRKQQDEMKAKYETFGGLEINKNDKLIKRDEAWKKQVYHLQNATQRESRRAVLERFGPGPHHVRFTVEFPTDVDPPERGTFLVELAPLDELPHANHIFLEQVYHELWDGTWFYLNGPHVLQAGPQDWDEDSAGEAVKVFTDANLDKLSFPEYSPSFPHLPFTMGFTGRPGGPDFYINKVDNVKSHGPHGQFQHSLDEQADSCFAKIIEGQDTLQKVFRLEVYPKDSGYPYFLEEPVEIVSARIVEPVAETVQKPKHTAASAHAAAAHAAAHKMKLPHRLEFNQESIDAAAAMAEQGGGRVKLPQRMDSNQEAIDAAKAEQIAKVMEHIGKNAGES